MAKILRSKKYLNRPTDPVFFNLGDRKQDLFFGAALLILLSPIYPHSLLYFSILCMQLVHISHWVNPPLLFFSSFVYFSDTENMEYGWRSRQSVNLLRGLKNFHKMSVSWKLVWKWSNGNANNRDIILHAWCFCSYPPSSSLLPSPSPPLLSVYLSLSHFLRMRKSEGGIKPTAAAPSQLDCPGVSRSDHSAGLSLKKWTKNFSSLFHVSLSLSLSLSLVLIHCLFCYLSFFIVVGGVAVEPANRTSSWRSASQGD